MQPVSRTARHYDSTTIALHWATAVLVAGQWLGAQVIDWFPRGPLRVDMRSVHICLGVLLTAVLGARVVWRATRGRRLPAADHGLLHVLAKAIHWLLYGLMIAMVSVGMVLAWTRGDSIFNLFSIPMYDPGNHALADRVQDIHADIGWIILAVAGLHACAALLHRLFWHDAVLSRMLPGEGSGL